MTSPKVRKTRAVALPGSGVGQERYQLYRNAYSRINQARSQGFHLEAITIIESLISDRLESRVSFLTKSDFSFKTLGQLIMKAQEVEADGKLLALVVKDLNGWRIRRNKALHEIAKIAEGGAAEWEARQAEFAATAEAGEALLRKIDQRCGQLRKTVQGALR